ncbi:MAG: NFACT family protein [Candidatus Aenigmarchaeota archaeon]|nr:NFACT family protein [Candidatus Aenigmarchaeota archaeon]
MREMSSLDLMFFLNELKFLEGGRIQKVFQKGKKLRFEIFLPGKGVFELFFEPGRLFITQYKRHFEEPGNFAMFLRKYLTNQIIKEVKQKDFDRIIEIDTENYILILEVFSKGNIILCYKDYKILMPLENQEWKHRTIKPGIKYEYPPAVVNPFKISLDDFKRLLNDKEIVKFIATDLSFSGLYAEEICIRAGVFKERPANLLSSEEIENVYEVIQKFKDEFGPQMIVENEKVIDAVPFDMKVYEGKEKVRTTTFTHALDDFFTKNEEERQEEAAENKTEKVLKRLENIAEEQRKNIEKMETEEKISREQAEAVFANLDKINSIISEMETLKKQGLKWSEIKERMKDKVKLIDEKKGKIILDL